MSDDLRLVRITVEHVGYVWATPSEVDQAVIGFPSLRFPDVTNIDGDVLFDLARRCEHDMVADQASAELVQEDEDGWVGVEDWHNVPARPGALGEGGEAVTRG